jgi:drug/metabolite transporter (DMT)-like permease
LINQQNENKEFSTLAALFTSFLCTVFGANAVAIKISLSGLGVFTTAGLRFSMAALAVLVWAVATRQSIYPKKEQFYQLLILSLAFIVRMSLLYLGLSKTHASRAVLLINLQPFLVLLLAHYFIPGDQITTRKILGLLIGFVGICFVFLEGKDVTADFRIGDFMILSTTIMWACSTIYIKRILSTFEPFQIVLYQMAIAAPFFFLEAFLWDRTMIIFIDSKVLAALLYQSLITASWGFVIWTNLLQKYGAVSLHSFIFIMPVAGVLLAGLLLGEPITRNILLALVLVASGILVVHFKPRKTTPLFLPGRGV